jgi:hypothetical protein
VDVASVGVIIQEESDNMIRTLVSLDEREYKLAKKEAKTLGISIAEFVRRSIRQNLPIGTEKAWMRYAGIVQTGDPKSSASESIDGLVYGTKD